MGKRSNFERVPRDFYPTPIEAMYPLVKFLAPDVKYIEPCAGDGALINHMSNLLPGSKCVWSGDVEPKAPEIEEYDALQLSKLKKELYRECRLYHHQPTMEPQDTSSND
jgi:hypothetical protein